MSMQYPVLDDRPINKWKVAELKEELKRRKLTTKGLKDDLVKRLDEAIRIERGAIEEEASRDIGSEPKLVVAHVDPLSNPDYVKMADDTHSGDINKTAKVDEVMAGVGIDGLGQGKVQVQKTISGIDSFETIIGKPVLEASMETRADETLNHDISRTAKIDEVVAGVDTDDGPAEIDQGNVREEEAIGGNKLSEMIVGEPILEVSMQTGADDSRKHDISKTAVGDEVVAGVDTVEGPHEMDQGKVQEAEAIGGTDSVMIFKEPVLRACMETSIRDNDIAAQIASSDKASGNNKTDQENKNLNFSLTDAPVVEEPVTLEASMKTGSMFNDIVVSQTALSEEPMQNNEIKIKNDDSKPLQMDAECDASYPNNQVYQVSPNVGFQVKSESISTDAVYVYENNELKDNLNADNVHLELDVTKVEMVQPTSSEGHSNDSNLHSLDDNKPDGDWSVVEETDDNKSTPVDFRKENDGVVGSSVMLKLDHNLVDNSMSDVMENKPSDSNHNFNIAMDKIELMEMPIANEGNLDGAVGPQLSPDKMKTYATETAAFDGKRLQEVDDNKSTSLDRIERTVADEGPMEKINLDHSSADDSMEEDILETKQIDSNDISTVMAEKIELAEVSGMKVDGTTDVVGLDSDKLRSSSEQKNGVSTASEKRKFQDEAAVGNKEPPKRQRRWNSESLKIPETQSSNLPLSTVPKDLFQTNMLKHNLTKSDSTISEGAPKERVVPPSPKPPTNSLRIDCFLRPFTLKAVQELLARTGNVCSFWMDHIKTHCYVTYSSPEEAIETRNALYNVQWPPNGGRLLVAEFVDPQEVKLRAEAPPNSTATPVSSSPTISATRAPIQPPSSTHQHGLKRPVSPQPPLSQPLHVSDLPTTKPLPPPPQVPEKVDQPIITLDDLFKKTRATPRIYYLPLTEEQVAAKRAKQNKNRQ